MRRRSAPRWELDPASSEDYGERVRAYDAYRSGERFRRWMDGRVAESHSLRFSKEERTPGFPFATLRL